MVSQHKIDQIIIRAFEEDMNYGDITTDTLIGDDQRSKAILIAKDDGIIAGCEVFSRVFHLMDKKVVIDYHKKDGDLVKQKDIIAHISGPTKSILKCERTALNIMQKLSGIATMTNSFVENTTDMPVRIVDTRKTTPGLRALEKYAVRVGGGYNHRYNLSDAVMIKDNHIKAVGSIRKAVEIAKTKIPHTMKVEIEVENLDGLREALKAEADIIMLDNMPIDMMKEAVLIAKGRAVLEASGNVDLGRVREIAETGVDIISVGALTHSVKAMDISMKFY